MASGEGDQTKKLNGALLEEAIKREWKFHRLYTVICELDCLGLYCDPNRSKE